MRPLRSLGVVLALVAMTGCYTFTCNDVCKLEIECLGMEAEQHTCAEACVQAKAVETAEQREARLQCWDCYQEQSCAAVRAGACSALCANR